MNGLSKFIRGVGASGACVVTDVKVSHLLRSLFHHRSMPCHTPLRLHSDTHSTACSASSRMCAITKPSALIWATSSIVASLKIVIQGCGVSKLAYEKISRYLETHHTRIS